jgi:hypothetical protein
MPARVPATLRCSQQSAVPHHASTMLCRLLNPTLVLTHQKFIRVQPVPIRGSGKAALGKAGAEILFSPCHPRQAALLLSSLSR